MITGAGERVDDDEERDDDGIALLNSGTGSSSTFRKLSGSWRLFFDAEPSALSSDGRFCDTAAGLCTEMDPLSKFATRESTRTTPSLSRASCMARSRFARLSAEIEADEDRGLICSCEDVRLRAMDDCELGGGRVSLSDQSRFMDCRPDCSVGMVDAKVDAELRATVARAAASVCVVVVVVV